MRSSARPCRAVTVPSIVNALLGLPLVLGGCHGASEAQASVVESAPPPMVRVVEVGRRADAHVTLRGTASAGARLRLGFKIPGVLARLSVTEGQRVEQGQLLATLTASQESAQLRAARAVLERANRDAARAEALQQKAAIAPVSRDDALTQLEVARANVAAASSVVGLTELRAPVTGIVFERLAEPGEAVLPGAPILLVDEADRTRVSVGVTERERGRVRVGNEAEIVVNVSGATLPAKVVSVAPAPSASDGLYEVQLRPAQADDGRMTPGALVEVRLSLADGAADVHVPLEAVVHRRDKDWVLLVEEKSQALMTRLVPVTLGRSVGRGVLVTAGLTGGERIVAEGAFFLEDGHAVRVIP